MCGIIGFAGNTEAVPILLDGLERLEYRGYDSAGVAVASPEGRLQVKKCKGRLGVLREALAAQKPLTGQVGIGHTRWATHGEPNDVNAHPHVSQSGKLAVVHNGIIENYLEIKQSLLHKGVVFASDTDTEVIVQLLEYYYKKSSNLMDAVYEVLNRIKGAYAMGILCSDFPEQLIAVRKDAPLLIGYGADGNYIASDVTALLAHTRTVTYMEDDEVAVVTADHVQILGRDGCFLEKEKHQIQWDVSAAEKGGYAHFMLKEIMEQPEAVRMHIQPRLADGEIVFEELEDERYLMKGISRIYLVACGSAYHVGMIGKYALERLLGIPVEACLASEFRYSGPLLGESALVIVISQSGETLDSMAALREAKRRGSKSPFHRKRHGKLHCQGIGSCALYVGGAGDRRGDHKGIYHTDCSSSHAGRLSGQAAGRIGSGEYQEIVRELHGLHERIGMVLKNLELYQKTAARYFNHDSVFYIGRNQDYALGMEGSLKLKEISYIHSESYAAGELKHGTISLIEPGTLVVALAVYEPLVEKMRSNIVEVRSRGAEVVAVTTEETRDMIGSQASEVFVIPKVHTLLQPVLGVVPLQLFAYYIALNRGCDIDKPRNLAKSVTVE